MLKRMEQKAAMAEDAYTKMSPIPSSGMASTDLLLLSDALSQNEAEVCFSFHFC